MNGSFRQRGAASWELRVYAGIDPETRKRRYRTATVTGNRADAERGLAKLVADVQSERTIGSASTVSELSPGLQALVRCLGTAAGANQDPLVAVAAALDLSKAAAELDRNDLLPPRREDNVGCEVGNV